MKMKNINETMCLTMRFGKLQCIQYKHVKILMDSEKASAAMAETLKRLGW